jgi:hypothetical protein
MLGPIKPKDRNTNHNRALLGMGGVLSQNGCDGPLRFILRRVCLPWAHAWPTSQKKGPAHPGCLPQNGSLVSKAWGLSLACAQSVALAFFPKGFARDAQRLVCKLLQVPMAKKGKDSVAYPPSGNGLDASTCSKQSQAFIEQQIALWGRVVKERKISVE